MLAGPAAWKNGSIVQIRYYLSGHNKEDPRFGVIAAMVSAFEGLLVGASTNWWWDGDWQRQSLAPWVTLGDPSNLYCQILRN
eukprot:m.217500 g.217500  ORF g.217500 m.217500 type:complete len:82 (+) comp15887_c0_seq2:871-1116(+)